MIVSIVDDAENHDGVDLIVDLENGLQHTYLLCEDEAEDLQEQLEGLIAEAQGNAVDMRIEHPYGMITTIILSLPDAKGLLECLKNKLAGHWKKGRCCHNGAD